MARRCPLRRLLAGAFMALVLFVTVFISACAHTPPQTILVPCHVSKVTRPDFPFDRLPVGADSFKQTQTLLADRDVRKGYEGQLEAAVGACQ